ncbi:MAG: hypothetical protein NTX03_05585 [Bacteroidetes bacterium]|nr:hypothetical protein [Bacteroidota bacterium]
MTNQNNSIAVKRTSLEVSLINEVTGDNLKELLVEGAEITIDHFLEESVLKEIPFFGTLYKATKAAFGLRESIFAKKVFKFLIELKDIPKEKREEFINNLEENKEYRQKVGEKLIILIEQLDDIEKPQIIGKLLMAAINEDITYEGFLRLSSIVQKAFLPDLKKLKTHPYIKGVNRLIEEHFVSIGVYSMKLEEDQINNNFIYFHKENEQNNSPPLVKYELNILGKNLIKYGLL